MPPSLARTYFEEYTAPGAVALFKSMPKSKPRTFENEWRDFKSGRTRDEDFPRIWSEAIGAFANTSGGVLVWGLYANTIPGSTVDAVKSLQTVENVNEFATRLKKAAKDNHNPPLSSIEIVPVPLHKRTEEGFVVCYIPEGDFKPYESLQAKERFYGRFDDRTERLPTPHLRAMFYPKRTMRCILLVEQTHVNHNPDDDSASFLFRLSLRNIGRYSVENAELAIYSPNYTLADTSGHNGANKATPPGTIFYAQPLIHPNRTYTYTCSATPKKPGDKAIRLYSMFAAKDATFKNTWTDLSEENGFGTKTIEIPLVQTD